MVFPWNLLIISSVKSSEVPPPSPHYAIFGQTKGGFSNSSEGSETLAMTSEGLWEMFKDDFEDTLMMMGEPVTL